MNVSQGGGAPAQDVMADMRASIARAAGETVEVEEGNGEAAADESANTGEAKAVEEKPAEKVDAPAEDKPAELPAEDKAAEVKPEEKAADDKSTEEKPDEQKTAEEKAPEEKPAEAKEDEQEKTPVEPSEADKLVEELGGVDVLKAAQPLIEAIYNPELPVSERMTALENFVPEAQMQEMRNEVFWQAAETPEIQQMLTADPEAREIFAQTNFGVSYEFLAHAIATDVKPFYDDEQIAEITKELKAKAPADGETKTEKPKADIPKPAEKPKARAAKEAEKKDEPSDPNVLTPAFTSILGNLSTDVEEIVSLAQLEEAATDDDDTKRLKTEAAKQFETEWSKAFLADEAAMKAYRAVKGLADSGAEAQAKQKYPVLAKHARRVAAQLIEKVSEPLATHRKAAQEKGKAVAAARTESPAAKKQEEFVEVPIVDVSTLQGDKDIERAMLDSMSRHKS
jgi:hypothetical protein